MLPLSRNSQSTIADSIIKEMSAEEKNVQHHPFILHPVQAKVETKAEEKKEAEK